MFCCVLISFIPKTLPRKNPAVFPFLFISGCVLTWETHLCFPQGAQGAGLSTEGFGGWAGPRKGFLGLKKCPRCRRRLEKTFWEWYFLEFLYVFYPGKTSGSVVWYAGFQGFCISHGHRGSLESAMRLPEPEKIKIRWTSEMIYVNKKNLISNKKHHISLITYHLLRRE